MYSKNHDPGAGDGPPPSRFQASGLRSRHLAAHVVVAVWVVLALLAASAQQTLPVARWLAIHLFLLGAATTAIVVWSEHFAVAMLHAPLPDRRWSNARLAGLNAGVAGVLTGVWADLPVLTGAGCVLLVTAVGAHLGVLVRMGRGALGGRLAPIADYYRAAAAALIIGAVLGWLLATGKAGPGHYTGLKLAHVHVTLLGWIGLPVLGTLFMLWPTVLGVRMAENTTRLARRVLALTGGGLLTAVAGLTAGWRPAAVLGIAGYTVGVAVAAQLFARTVRRRPAISAAAAWMLAAAAGWLVVGVVVDLVVLAARPLGEIQDDIGSLVPVLLVGLVAQVLLGALTYLLPIVLASGPKERAALRTVLERGWAPRLVVLNLGIVLLALPLPGPLGTVGMLLAGAAGAAFLALALRVLVRSARGLLQDADKAGVARRPAVWGTAVGAVVTVLAVLVANSGGDTSGGTSAAGTAGAGAGTTRTVAVTLADMRIRPARVEVAAGTDLRLKVTNTDAQRHDLKVEDGPSTPMLAKGHTRVLGLGQVTEDREAWCTLPGHKAAGMTMDIVVKDDTATDSSGHEGHPSAAADSGGLDLSADFSSGWQPRTADLTPAPGGTVHKVELHAAHTTVEVAPGAKQQMWTFGGTAPGPTLHGKVGDVFEVTLVNDDPSMGHGIDFHAGSLAPDRPMRTIQPGERLVYRFRAEKAGAWLYHCSTAPMLQHMGNGMYGAVIIDPPGLKKVDHEYVLVSSELYLGTPGSTAQVTKMRQNTPDAWVFNGVADQYAQRPLKVKAGERARFWVIAAGPSDGIAFHLVGAVFDTVYKEGAYLLKPDQVGGSQVLDLATAQGGFVETTFPGAGHYAFVDHDMRHAEAGAHGMVEVSE
ncbi:multicopper oxidase domain-containing protein [Streptomyces sp. ME08-AFT2]|uniref:multicopper oxidase domain-containing protein n=1 Tax=Streptomyces TaxID=1883 RepID=UPI000A38BD35|nr:MULTISPECIES: multicopper oxidase domain-containing protein [Streptomyces]MDX2758850.1 multicopper oxidase domain-containing protein [Streptomyces europaeiscabiei]MDX3314835.1 multicopper oxidase domain-containing protein [Streptomyces sp. ME08-AFT2]MDX3632520.1 multicopper oxidase domain-containing protein [Streptomyces europaeiscabiei]MDX3646803.1 multicopper oxidase domain-containing protein [Streptomyces europaeiscabiei]